MPWMSSRDSVFAKEKGPFLVIDGSHRSVFAGILDGGERWLSHSDTEGAPLEQLFPAVQFALGQAALELAEIGGFIYSAGPGSVLGLRLCAMAIETWCRLTPDRPPLFAYNSLQLTAALLRQDGAPEEALLVSDWKKGAWHAIRFHAGQPGGLEVIDDRMLREWQGPLYHLPQRKGWQSPPEASTTLPYAPTRLPEVLPRVNLLTETEGVELYNTDSPAFQKWTPQRHRA